jgi:hypothetical protein
LPFLIWIASGNTLAMTLMACALPLVPLAKANGNIEHWAKARLSFGATAAGFSPVLATAIGFNRWWQHLC